MADFIFFTKFYQGIYLDDFHENVSEKGNVKLIFAKTFAKTQYLDALSRKCSRNGHVWTIFVKMFCEYGDFSRNKIFSIFAKMEKGISVSNLALVNACILYGYGIVRKKLLKQEE